MTLTGYLPQALSLLIPALSGLVGVVLSALLTSWNQRQERHHRFLLDQLSGFYSPMLAYRKRTRAKGELRLKISNAASAAWRSEISTAREAGGVARVQETRQELSPHFEKIIDYNNQQLRNELIPLYAQMLDLFTKKMHLAEPSTRTHYAALVEYVELWERYFRESLPHTVAEQVSADENALIPLYDDLEKHFERLQANLKK
jgi:hypothetical protein